MRGIRFLWWPFLILQSAGARSGTKTSSELLGQVIGSFESIPTVSSPQTPDYSCSQGLAPADRKTQNGRQSLRIDKVSNNINSNLYNLVGCEPGTAG